MNDPWKDAYLDDRSMRHQVERKLRKMPTEDPFGGWLWVMAGLAGSAIAVGGLVAYGLFALLTP